jgi:hypothetical protein
VNTFAFFRFRSQKQEKNSSKKNLHGATKLFSLEKYRCIYRSAFLNHSKKSLEKHNI